MCMSKISIDHFIQNVCQLDYRYPYNIFIEKLRLGEAIAKHKLTDKSVCCDFTFYYTDRTKLDALPNKGNI